ncbi:peptidoglycan-binding protein [Streptomyces coeruleorubidus]|uniref:peptidoglycan-binding protein n=1 Tax=Streptomyces coeruleorubidus TaxID=116188 RepID=UPI0036C70FF6
MGESAPRRTRADGPTTSPHAEAPPAQAPARATDDAPRRTPGRAAGNTPRPPQTHPAQPPHTDVPARTPDYAPRRPVTNPGQARLAEGAATPPSPADVTMPLRPVAPDATTVLPASPDTSVLPTPLTPAATEPSVTDLRLFDGTGGPDRGRPEADESGRRPRRRRRNALLATAAGACVAVVAAAGYASGMFSYEAPSRNSALPDDLRASVPDAPSSSAASTPPAESAQAAPPAPAVPPPATRSPSASPSPSTPSASPSPTQSATPSAPRTSATATSPESRPPDRSRQNGGSTVLRPGDRGPEVTELQLRLRQLYLYDEDTDGDYDSRLEEAVRTYQWSRGIQTDDLGVYDGETRAKLESETKEP